jgi:hypothetical protein
MIVNPIDENKKRLEEQAKKEGKVLEERMRLQKQQATKLKIDAKKRELEEVKRKIALKTSEKNGLILVLNDLKNKERTTEQSIKNSDRKNIKEEEISFKKQEKGKIRREIEQFELGAGKKKIGGMQKAAQKQNEINIKKRELDRLKQQEVAIMAELNKLGQELIILKNQETESAPAINQELARKINTEKAIESEIKELERTKNFSQLQTDSTKRTKEELKRMIEGEERRLRAVEGELTKLTTEQRRLEQEVRGL